MGVAARLGVLAATALVVLASAAAAGAQTGPVFREGQAQIVPELADPSTWVRHDLWIETEFDSDGDGRRDRVHADVTRPGQTDTEGLKVPVVYESSPYYSGTASTQSQYFWNVNHEVGATPPPRLSPPPIPHQPRSPIISNSQVDTWVPRAFAVVHSESPGTGLSEGCPTVGDTNESLAPKAVIDWLNGRAKGYTTRDGDVEVEAYWSTGKVGMTGTSYNGTLPVAAASTGVRGLEAIIPIAPNTSYYHYYRSNGLVRNPGGWVGEDIDYLFDYINSGFPDRRQYCIDTVRVGEMNRFQDRVTGDYNAFWAGRDYLNVARRIETPTLMAHAFNDWNVVPEHSVRISDVLERERVPVMEYFHQGGHGGAPPLVLRNRWFTRYLYGVRNGVERDADAWITREAESCPPRTATVVGDQANTATLAVDDTRRLQLGMTLTIPQTNADGTVTNTTRVIDSIPSRTTVVLASAVATAAGQRVADGTTVGIACGAANPTPYDDYPNPAARRVTLRPTPGGNGIGGLTAGRRSRGVETLVDDVGCQAGTLAQAASSPHRLLYATRPLTQPLHLSGTPSIRVRLAASKPAANLSVWLVTLPWTAAAPCTSPATPVANLVTRGWADPQNRGSLSRSRPLRPGRFYDVKFPLQPDDQVIPAGRQLGLMIFSSDREFTLRPQPGTELTVDLRRTSLRLPVVGGRKGLEVR
jgi:X-Pro dipeptidyl-peptidase